jgi:predicted transcriptional regulator
VKKKALNANQLGELEGQVMRVLWDIQEGAVQDVSARLDTGKNLAYTTVMTVLSRLVEKGFLSREKRGRAYVYRPTVSQQSIADSALQLVVDRFFDGVNTRAVAHLLGAAEDVDEQELRRLESAVRAKRKGKR